MRWMDCAEQPSSADGHGRFLLKRADAPTSNGVPKFSAMIFPPSGVSARSICTMMEDLLSLVRNRAGRDCVMALKNTAAAGQRRKRSNGHVRALKQGEIAFSCFHLALMATLPARARRSDQLMSPWPFPNSSVFRSISAFAALSFSIAPPRDFLSSAESSSLQWDGARQRHAAGHMVIIRHGWTRRQASRVACSVLNGRLNARGNSQEDN